MLANTLNELLEPKRLLTHPFYRKWEMGELSREGLQDYAAQYYAIESSLTELAEGPEWEDEKTHPELWLQFCEAIGIPRAEVLATPLRPATEALVAMNRRYKGTPAAVGALHAYEIQAADIARFKKDALAEHYGIDTGVKFFEVHSAVEDDHAAAGLALFQQSPETALPAFEEALQSHWDFLTQALEVEEQLTAA